MKIRVILSMKPGAYLVVVSLRLDNVYEYVSAKNMSTVIMF